MSRWTDARDFQERFGFPVGVEPTRELVLERVARTKEELREYVAALTYFENCVSGPLADPAHVRRALQELAGETADVEYVLVGTLVWFGVNYPAVWREVHRANMEKTPPAAGSWKPKKPAGWRPPDLSAAFGEADPDLLGLTCAYPGCTEEHEVFQAGCGAHTCGWDDCREITDDENRTTTRCPAHRHL
jgi:hypothetical protein